MPSLKLPSVTEVAITTIKELLALSTLPYYQVSGNLKAAEGAVVVGDPIAWEASSGKYIKFDAGDAAVADEAVGTGNGTLKVYNLAHGNIVSITNVKVNAVAQVEGTDFWVDYSTGEIFFATAPGSTLAITASYVWAANASVELGKCIGFVRIPGDSTGTADVPIEVVIGGAVKYSVISLAVKYSAIILRQLSARYVVAADAVIF